MWDNGNRARDPIDFTVGAGVFLLTLAFVIAFVPTLFDPFGGGDRLAGGERSRRCRRRRRPARGVAGGTGRAVASLYGRLSQRERDARKRG